MVVGLAFLATAISVLFAQAMLVRYTSGHKPQHLAWLVALAMFALASAALATGTSTGWDKGTFRVFFLFGAILNVPWLALGTVYLVFSERFARRVHLGLLVVSGFAAGVVLAAPMEAVSGTAIPQGSDVFGALPRILAAVGSGVGATVIFVGALVSAVRFARGRVPGGARLATANALIALGTLVLASGGLVQGAIGHDEAFALSLALGISIIYGGFALAGSAPRRERAAAADDDAREGAAAPVSDLQ
ncbi:MAG: hypothetical protein ABWY80_05105, partial [Acidimicrobiia bacterium]